MDKGRVSTLEKLSGDGCDGREVIVNMSSVVGCQCRGLCGRVGGHVGSAM